MTDMTPLSLSIAGTTLDLRCPPDQAALLKSAAEALNQEINQIKKGNSEINPARAAILAALKVIVTYQASPSERVAPETATKVDTILTQLHEALA